MPICEKCGKQHDGTFGSGRFCSRACANSHIVSKDTKDKISRSLRNSFRKRQVNTGSKRLGAKKEYNYILVKDNPGLDIPVQTCKICGNQFYHIHSRGVCNSPTCKTMYHKLVQKDARTNTSKIQYRVGKEWTGDAYKQIYKYYFTYKITNLLNGRYYFGIHAANNLGDGYMGSGVCIRGAIKKYGKSNFKREILQYFTCYKDLADAEHELITEDVLKDPNSYNLTTGGIGGPCFKGRHHTEESKKKVSHGLKEYYKNNIHHAKHKYC